MPHGDAKFIDGRPVVPVGNIVLLSVMAKSGQDGYPYHSGDPNGLRFSEARFFPDSTIAR